MTSCDKVYLILRNNDGSWTYNKNFILEFPLSNICFSKYQYEPRLFLSQHIGKKVVCIFYASTTQGIVDAQFLVTGHLGINEHPDIGRDREVKEEISENYRELVNDFPADHIIKNKYKVGDYLILKDNLSVFDFVNNIGPCEGKEDNDIFGIGIVDISPYLIFMLETRLNTLKKIYERKKLTLFEFKTHIESIEKSEKLYDSINRSIAPFHIHINQIINSQKINGRKRRNTSIIKIRNK